MLEDTHIHRFTVKRQKRKKLLTFKITCNKYGDVTSPGMF